MNRYALALCAVITATGCASCDPKSDPCKSVVCENNGTCQNSACSCATTFYGDTCGLHFDPTEYLASKTFCASESGRVEITGATGQYAGMNGYYADIPANTFDRCVWVLLTPALGTNLPAPGRPGSIISQAHGLEILAVERDNPVLPSGDLNEVTPLNEVGLLFKGHRGSVLFFREAENRFEDVPFSIVADGSLGRTLHFSPFYLLNTVPAAQATATQKSGRAVEMNFAGTADEGSSLAWGLTYQVWEDGILLDERMGNQLWDLNLPGGSHTLTFRVRDPYGMEDAKTSTVNVDLCTGNACLNWQTCRTVDGVCIGDDPCDPNPCMNSGACSPTGIGTFSCSCNTSWNWTGADCSVCPSGSYVNGAGNCVDDPCLPDPCNGHGTCSKPSGLAVCSCATGYDGGTCNACGIGYGGNNCVPNPTASNLNVDCSGTGDQCASQWPAGYPATFSYANATSCVASVSQVTGMVDAGSVSAVSLDGGVGSFSYVTGGQSLDVVRMTVVCINADNPNTATTTKDITLF